MSTAFDDFGGQRGDGLCPQLREGTEALPRPYRNTAHNEKVAEQTKVLLLPYWNSISFWNLYFSESPADQTPEEHVTGAVLL